MEELKKWLASEKETYTKNKLSAQQNNNQSALDNAKTFIKAYEKVSQKINEIETSKTK